MEKQKDQKYLIFFLKLVFQSESVYRLPWEIRRSEIMLTLIKNKRKKKNKGNHEINNQQKALGVNVQLRSEYS